MVGEKEQNQIAINMLAEIIYELYKDLLKGKLKNDLCLRDKEQGTEKSATESQTFQWPAHINKYM